MSRMKRRNLWFATVGGLALVVLGWFAFTAVNRHKNTLRLVEVVKQGDNADEAEVRSLLARGADPNAFVQASTSTLVDVLRVVFHRAKPQDNGTTILMYAAAECSDQIMKGLLDAGGNVHARDNDGDSALDYAVSMSRRANVEVLVLYGADVNCSSKYITPITKALTNNDIEDFRFLLAHGANPNCHDAGGETPLMYAVKDHSAEDIPALLKAGARINTRDCEGGTALMWAAQDGNMEATTILLQASADPTLRDQYGKTAEDWAVINGHKEVARFLKNYLTHVLNHE
jgi:ankyrin repeat protein